MNKQSGFTLIELVVVIIILGILAATAAPKFMNLSADAYTSTLQGVKISMQGASALVNSKAIVKGNQNIGFGLTNTVNLDNNEVLIQYGYPIATAMAGLIELDVDDYATVTIGNSLVVYPKALATPTSITADCIVYYVVPSGENIKPTIEVNPCI